MRERLSDIKARARKRTKERLFGAMYASANPVVAAYAAMWCLDGGVTDNQASVLYSFAVKEGIVFG